MKEPELFEETWRAIQDSGEDTSPLAIFRSAILITMVLTSLLALGIQGASYFLAQKSERNLQQFR
jgi:hypothetical protein